MKEERQDKVIDFLCKIYEAQQWDRLGYSSKANELLREALKQSPSEQVRRVPLFKIKVLDNEIFHLKEALITFKNALRNNAENLDLNYLPYLLGELHRRIGLYPESKAWLRLALKLSKDEYNQIFYKWAEENYLSLSKNLPNAPNDGELILIAKTEKMILEKRAKLSNELKPESQPNFSTNVINEWLESIHRASVFYYKELNLDPKNVKELVDMGLFKNDPRLEKQATRLFSLKVSKSEFNPITRYNVNCKISFSDKNGYYRPSLIEGEIIKSRQF